MIVQPQFQSANNRVFNSKMEQDASEAAYEMGFNPLIIASSIQSFRLLLRALRVPACFNPLIIASSIQRRHPIHYSLPRAYVSIR